MALPDANRLFTERAYCSGSRVVRWESTVALQRAENKQLTGTGIEEVFVRMREAGDRTLPMPKLILHALQVNIRGGCLPELEANGVRFLKIAPNAIEVTAWDG